MIVGDRVVLWADTDVVDVSGVYRVMARTITIEDGDEATVELTLVPADHWG